MNFNPRVFDLWVFHRQGPEPEYLLLHVSPEKAERWYSSVQFWQVLSDFFDEDDTVMQAINRLLGRHDIDATSVWAAEHSYSFYNRRFDELQHCTAFAVEVEGPLEILLGTEHSEYGWFTAAECFAKLRFRGLKEGLRSTIDYVSERPEPMEELRIS